MTLAALALAVTLGAPPPPGVPPPPGAAGTGGCHCFRDRTFEPERPAAADPYVLATTRSSVLSAAFGPSKRALVQAVMTGTAPDDLWVAHWAAHRTGLDADALLERKAGSGSWRATLAATSGLGAPFAAAVARGAPDAELAEVAVDDTLVARLGADPAALAAARAAGATSSELLIAAVIAARLGSTPASVLEPVKAGRATWGGLLHALGLAPKDLDGVVRALVR